MAMAMGARWPGSSGTRPLPRCSWSRTCTNYTPMLFLNASGLPPSVTRTLQGLAGLVSQAAGTGAIAVAVRRQGDVGAHRCPSPPRAVEDVVTKSGDLKSGGPTGTGHVRAARAPLPCRNFTVKKSPPTFVQAGPMDPWALMQKALLDALVL